REIGAVVFRSVADATVVRVVGFLRFADVPLLADEVGAALDDGRLVHVAFRGDEGGDGGGGVVNGKAPVVDAAVLFLLPEKPGVALLDVGRELFPEVEGGIPDRGGQGEGGEGGEFGVVPVTLRFLL